MKAIVIVGTGATEKKLISLLWEDSGDFRFVVQPINNGF